VELSETPKEQGVPAAAAVIKVLEYLSQTKARSIEFLTTWIKQTSETDIRAGLMSQLVDERRHLRLLNEALRKLGVRAASIRRDVRLSRLFEETNALDLDVHRICAFHRGVKVFTLDRCCHLVPIVGPELSALLDLIARDEERHIRWADIRLARLLTHAEMRTSNQLMGQVGALLDAVWARTWRRVTHPLAV
jgi:hypothetical protein